MRCFLPAQNAQAALLELPAQGLCGADWEECGGYISVRGTPHRLATATGRLRWGAFAVPGQPGSAVYSLALVSFHESQALIASIHSPYLSAHNAYFLPDYVR